MPLVISFVLRRFVVIRFVVFFLLMALTSPLAAGTLEPTEAGQRWKLGLRLELFTDPSRQMTAAQVAGAQGWVQSQVEVPNFGFSTDSHWARFSLRNPHTVPKAWILEVGSSLIDEVSLFAADPQGNWIEHRNGESVPFSQREFFFKNPIFEIKLAPGESQDFMIQFFDEGSTPYPVELWEVKTHFQQAQQEQFILGIYFGILLAIFSYNLLLWVSTREENYYAYVAYIGCFLLFTIGWFGAGQEYIYPDLDIWWINRLTGFFLTGAMYWMGRFSQVFLETQRHTPRMDRLIHWVSFGFLAAAISFWVPGMYLIGVLLVSQLTLILASILLVTSLLCLRAKVRSARFYLVAYTLLLISVAIAALRTAGIAPTNALTDFSVLIGSALEMILLAFSVADRFNQLKIEKESAQSEKIQIQQNLTNQLEINVAERTTELQKAVETKDRFFSIIAHDLRSPIGSLDVIFNQLTKAPSDIDLDLYQSIRSTTTHTNRLLDNLLTWARNQKGEVEYRPQNCQLSQLIESAISPLAEAGRIKGVEISQDCHQNLYAWADPSMLATVIRNLVSNAIKFTGRGGEIQVSASLQVDEIRVEVRDTGVGIDADTLDKLFRLGETISSLGTNQESGTGLGLVLCKEFVEKNQGRIGVESKLDHGSRFWFTLPKGVAQKREGEGWIGRLKSLDVMVVEDNPLHVQSTHKALEDYNLVALAIDGPRAVEKGLGMSGGLILMDIELPGFNGIEAARQIWAQAPVRPWIIALTSYSQKEVEAQSGGLRFDGYLGKPLDRDELMLALYPLLNES